MVDQKIVIVTQARIGSTRFPGKVLEAIGEESMLDLHLKRLKSSNLGNKIVVATTFEDESYKIAEIANRNSVEVFQGSTDDVLDRFYQAVVNLKCDYVVRVTSDCPLIDPELIDEVIRMTIDENLDYGANILKEEFPDGQDIEVMRFQALEKAWKEADLKSEREHVTPFIRKNTDFNGETMFRANNYNAPFNCNSIRMTVDEPKDIEAIRHLVGKLGVDKSWMEYTDYIVTHSNEFPNQKILRNEGYIKSIQKEINENRTGTV